MKDARIPALTVLHGELEACRACPRMVGPVIHGPPVVSRVYAFGQAPGPHEGRFGRPFAWTAGRTLFSWFETALGVSETAFRERVYMGAVCRCFPGKNPKGGDRKPAPDEIAACRPFIEREVAILRPSLILPIGQVAIGEVLGARPLADVVGRSFRVRFHSVEAHVLPLPHPSGASTWFKTDPGRALLARALRRIGRHPAWRATFPRVTPPPRARAVRVSSRARPTSRAR